MFNTITKKIMGLIFVISLAVLLLVMALFPSLFYSIMKPHLLSQVSSILSSSALRQSYIWKNNSTLNQLQNSKTLWTLISQYEALSREQPAKEQQLRDEIISYLPVIRNGIDRDDPYGEHGYIKSTHYFLLFTDKGDVFYPEESEPAARTFLSSIWWQTLDKTLDYMEHPPLMTDPENPDFRILCMVSSFWAGDTNCFAVNAVDFNDIKAQFQEMEEFGITDYLILGDGEILYQNLPESSHINLSSFPSEMFEGNQYDIRLYTQNGDTNFCVLCTYKKEFYRLIVHVPKEVLLSPYSQVFFYFALLLGGIILLLLLLFYITIKGNLKRLTKLERQMNRVKKGDYNVAVTDTGKDEIGSLSLSFNKMLSQIRTDMKNQEKMQYTLMVSAIDPHYIYNTLNTVTALAELGRNRDVVTVNDALIVTLKDRMKLKNYKIFDTVQAERDVLKQYMVIQGYLCFQKILFDFQVPPKDLGLLIPKNIIQPLVENSIKHGILCVEDKDASVPYQGKITVSLTRAGEQIHVEVTDNGAGMDESTVKRYFSASKNGKMTPEIQMEHIGTYNVQMRLWFLYGGKAQFSVKSTPGQGTRIHLVLPVIDTGAAPVTIEDFYKA